MRKLRLSFNTLCVGAVGTLFVVYIALIAVVMTYATLTIEFSQSIQNDTSRVAVLEAEYLALVSRLTTTDYAAAGYAIPQATRYVTTKSATAIR